MSATLGPAVDQRMLRSTRGAAPTADGGQKTERLLEVFVLYTTVRNTLTALQAAAKLACGLPAQIRLVVPHVVPYPRPLDEPAVQPLELERHFRTLAGETGIDTWVDIRLCREPWEAIRQALGARSIVVIGVRRRWWMTGEKRLAERLKRAGHDVVLSETK